MNDTASPILEEDLEVAVDYGQLYIYSPAVYAEAVEENAGVNLDALDDAITSQRFVGLTDGFVDLLTPGQWNYHTPVRVEVWTGEPPATDDDWSHEVDLDLDIPDGKLAFEGPTCPPVITEVPAGSYRARLSGRGYTALGGSGADGEDSYRVRLWPRTTDREPELLRSWPGWDGFQ
jgi:hypothetical protein